MFLPFSHLIIFYPAMLPLYALGLVVLLGPTVVSHLALLCSIFIRELDFMCCARSLLFGSANTYLTKLAEGAYINWRTFIYVNDDASGIS